MELVKQVFGELQGRSILILGAGEMSALTAKHLLANGANTVMVSNRSYDRAKTLASACHGKAIRFADFEESLIDADIVISATAAANFVINPDQVRNVMIKRNNRPLLMIDIAVPRDIHPEVGEIPGVTLYDIDDLRGVIDAHQHAREIAGQQAEHIIEEEMSQFLKWHNSLYVVPTIVALQHRGEEIKAYQLEHALGKLGGLTAKQEKIIRSMANSIVNQLLHEPITNLKEFATTKQGHLYTEILQNLFSLEVAEEETVHSLHPHVQNQGNVDSRRAK